MRCVCGYSICVTTFAVCSKRQRIALLALVGGLAAAAAPQAAAEDVLPAAPQTVLPDAGAIAAAAVATAVPVEFELPPPVPVPAPEPEPEPAEQPEPEQAPEQAPEQSEPAEASPPSAPAVESPVPPAPAPDPLPAVSQVEPVNVNVSIRIDSPGDDGAVTQANVAAGSPAAPTVPEARYHENPPQYRPAPAAEPAAAPAPAAPATVPESPQATWTWNWECGNGLPSGFAPPAGTLPQSWIWNWTGNCGSGGTQPTITPTENVPQYQPGVTQYQPVNVNVSIRVASPGSNGPVVQANVAVAVALPPAPALPVVQPPSPSLPSPPAAGAAPVPAPSEAPPAETPPAPAPVDVPPVGEPSTAPPEDPEATLLAASPSAPLTMPPSAEPAALAAERELGGARTPSARIHVTAQLVQRLAAPRPALEAAARSRVPVQRTQRAPLAIGFTGEQVVALGSVSPGPAAADRTPLLLFVFLAAFVLAFADAAWRVRDEWRTAAAEPGRRRERPG